MEKMISLTEEVIDAVDYFSNIGYHITPDFPEMFFRCIEAMPGDEISKRNDTSSFKDIFSGLLVKTPDESAKFDSDFSAFLKRQRIVSKEEYDSIKDKSSQASKKLKQSQGMAKQYDKAASDAQKRMKTYQDQAEKCVSFFSDEEQNKIQKKINKYGSDLSKASGMSMKTIASLYNGKSAITKDDIKKYRQKLEKATAKAVMYDNYKEVISLIKALGKMAAKAADLVKDDPASLAKSEKNRYEEYKKLYEQELKNIEKYSRTAEEVVTVKAKSQSHRPFFVPGGSVISYGEGDPEVLQKNFDKLKSDDFLKIYDYIRDHAQQFRTRVSRNIRTSAGHRIDFAETCRKACATGGVPVRLEMIKPKRQKTSLVIISDVSGSCRSASMIVLSFMQAMSEVFGGGCHSFVFVNSLYDITESFADGEDAGHVLDNIPTKGVYSDYNKPLRQFNEEKMFLINSDTIVIFIGDARNNSNPTGEEYMKNICRKARNAYFINTEEKEKWDCKDSIMSVYAPYMKKYAPALNTMQLLSFLMEVK